MKKIIIGQVMMWGNIIGVVVGFMLFKNTEIMSSYVNGLLGFLGVVGSCFNLFVAISLQIKGYKEDNIINFD